MLYVESHSGWSLKPDPFGGYQIVDANGWTLARIDYDHRYTSNATNHFRAGLFATAPDLYEYVKSSASAGCATAKALVERVEAA